MAYSVTKSETVYGNKRVALCDVTADAATGNVPTGLTKVDAVSLGSKSMHSFGVKMSVSGGTVAFTGATSGDAFYLIVHGA